MANSYHKSSGPERSHSPLPPPGLPDLPEASRMLHQVQAFLAACRKPAALELGEPAIELTPSNYSLELASGRLWLEIWDDQRCISRRILELRSASVGVLDCSVQRFGTKPGTLTLLDLARPQTAKRSLRGNRQAFAETFRRMLSRQFPGWQIDRLSSALDLHHSFSSTFARACLRRGTERLAAMACASPEEENPLLSSALLWHDHISNLARPGRRVSLALFLPEGAGTLTAHRLRWLTGRPLHARVFLYNADGMAGEVDPQDLGNIETRVAAHYAAPELPALFVPLLPLLLEIDGVTCCPQIDGLLSIRFQGLEFARLENSKVSLGIETKEEVAPEHFNRLIEFALHLHGLTTANGSRDSELPRYPERWLEGAVRKSLPAIDASLLVNPVHSQVLIFAGLDRDLIDLLAVSAAGQLAILELKTTEDIQLPLQALDYWIRIRWHVSRRELSSLFPGVTLNGAAAHLLLVAPAMCFHPSNEIVLRYFSPEIRVERIGINSEWHGKLQVVLRLAGAEQPISHRSSL